uniref:Uncharacterized protein n=1 Tax=Entomoneis paludosa TaxID=265537 RepID=A0A7S2VDU5_9STRA|mmetsp:Transcript_16093/g.33304  ORF Transcript_16093/g.33304 Transcript_16093/m.33304 type:complete len:141 (+) Transcript_16093:183-605(+)|eukprot:CAMPEP_0172447080 /NCGR_PEP_ID=MMETSP1065-20121228/6462_1 /TAXON_ID=265537 /ORGANISM="Amphiprora paludosa, Strain CCMP125" /LENGTH=140 /DNA_ID=CAMNT_0013198293 /DNA_START=146 /DNA_END=568 /DNA_ORIENTATION=-
MITGLKRSMPCEDLLSLTPPQEKVLLEANKFLDDSVRSLLSSGKRRRVMNTDQDLLENPATAALEASLTFEDDYDTDFLFEPIKISLIPSTFNEFSFPSPDRTPNFTCAKQHKTMSLASVQTVNEMTCALAYLSTATKAA